MHFFSDTWFLFVRSMKETLRTPVWMIVGLFAPICYMLLFEPLLDPVANVPGFPPGGALAVFTPGVLIMLSFYSAAFVCYGLLAELRSGVIERLRVTPASRMALLLGRVLRDIVILLIQALLLIVVAWLMGLRANLAGVALTFVLLVFIGLLMASFSYALALVMRDENAVGSTLNMLTMPLLLLSGVMLPLSLAPAVIRNIAVVNPFTYAVDAARALFLGNFGDVRVIEGFVILGVLALLTFWWASSSFRRAVA
ncbi:MAG: ABC transporter permease [Ktedonobacteraceae bacterium]|nr:ABC transporter permease [Ktedonobacteraceae bacterium]